MSHLIFIAALSIWVAVLLPFGVAQVLTSRTLFEF